MIHILKNLLLSYNLPDGTSGNHIMSVGICPLRFLVQNDDMNKFGLRPIILATVPLIMLCAWMPCTIRIRAPMKNDCFKKFVHIFNNILFPQNIVRNYNSLHRLKIYYFVIVFANDRVWIKSKFC